MEVRSLAFRPNFALQLQLSHFNSSAGALRPGWHYGTGAYDPATSRTRDFTPFAHHKPGTGKSKKTDARLSPGAGEEAAAQGLVGEHAEALSGSNADVVAMLPCAVFQWDGAAARRAFAPVHGSTRDAIIAPFKQRCAREAVERHVASATQNQALSALLFLYRQVLGVELPWLDDVVRAKQPERLPVVLTRSEVQRVLERMDGVYGLLARLLYGTGMRLMEVIRLRVKDVDFAQRSCLVRHPG